MEKRIFRCLSGSSNYIRHDIKTFYDNRDREREKVRSKWMKADATRYKNRELIFHELKIIKSKSILSKERVEKWYNEVRKI